VAGGAPGRWRMKRHGSSVISFPKRRGFRPELEVRLLEAELGAAIRLASERPTVENLRVVDELRPRYLAAFSAVFGKGAA
jgi:hypothetical protein